MSLDDDVQEINNAVRTEVTLHRLRRAVKKLEKSVFSAQVEYAEEGEAVLTDVLWWGRDVSHYVEKLEQLQAEQSA